MRNWWAWLLLLCTVLPLRLRLVLLHRCFRIQPIAIEFKMVLSRRGSGSVTLPTGQTLAIHTRTHDEEDLPHATKKCVLRLRLCFSTYVGSMEH
jgi:hypothetical protein